MTIPSSTDASTAPASRLAITGDAVIDAASLRAASFETLHRTPTLPRPGDGHTLARWRALAAIAARDLCLVKVLEAHHDAAAILADLGAPAPAPGELWAVWAAEAPDAVLHFTDAGSGVGTVSGGKAWCSGAGFVTHALLTARTGEDRQLVRVALADAGVSAPDTQWPAVGMSRIVSGALRFEAAPAIAVGDAGAYLRRPGFWHGGAGIAACWFGGARAIAQTLRTHPRIATDPHAAAHLGALDLQLGAAAALLRALAAAIDADPGDPRVRDVVRVRSFVERAATETIDRVGRALGAGPLCADAAHARRCADLATFLRQSHAERDWETLGRQAADDDASWSL